uniref:Melanocortin 2 receptor accessory protein n=1 Tax=Oncorhynchus tshawytscha TaxID=74940 RepID=A0AAZ3RX63_ONCTS
MRMINSTNSSQDSWRYEWEYYYDYLDPIPVDERKLKYNKYLIVIVFWISLAAFVGFLFAILTFMSRSVSLPKAHSSKTAKKSWRNPRSNSARWRIRDLFSA